MKSDLNTAKASDLTNKVDEYSVDALSIDNAREQKETTWVNTKWTQQWGYFNSIAELKSAILMKAIWNVGKGYTADAEIKVILDHISGWGKDTFDDIIFNMDVVRRIGGDSYAEIIRDNDTGTLINLKPLDPGNMQIVVNQQGIIIRYEQINKIGFKGYKKFQPEDIFHLSHNRIGDQIHGISDITAVEKIILADAENFDDMKKVMHRQAKPMIMFKVGTDNPSKLDTFITKMDEATNKGENIFIPNDPDSVEIEVIQAAPSPIILQWRDELRNKFYRTVGLPQIIFGSAGSTESGGKIEYLAHEQVFEKDQRYLEKQIEAQLGFKINFIPPTTLLENLQTDEAKDNQNALTSYVNALISKIHHSYYNIVRKNAENCKKCFRYIICFSKYAPAY